MRGRTFSRWQFSYMVVSMRIFERKGKSWEDHRLRVLRRIFGPKRDEVTGDWRKLHNEELHNLYSSPSVIKVI
jgi:hypothetical protein